MNIVPVPEHIKRKMKGSRRYKNENRIRPKKIVKPWQTCNTVKSNWWTRFKKYIKCVIGRKKKII